MTQIKFNSIKALFQPLDKSNLKAHWQRLHSGDCEPWPESDEVQQAWLAFHNGQFLDCAEMSGGLQGYESLRLKSLATYAHYLEADAAKKVERLLAVVDEAETFLQSGRHNSANIHYQIAYGLGRYAQYISVAKALTEGIAGRVSAALSHCLDTEPNHADAHTAFATYEAELIGKMGKMAARIAYAVSPDDAVEHYEKGISLAPFSISAKTEYADGLLAMFGKKKQPQAISLYQDAVKHSPVDALEAMDYYLAKQELSGV